MKNLERTNHLVCALVVLGLGACGGEEGAEDVAPGNAGHHWVEDIS